ncbi:MAG: hypothetical protein OEZ22_11420 [Spirochaetia bacterium]|nr:hypothetical protein [Spirochaetia bacterium]
MKNYAKIVFLLIYFYNFNIFAQDKTELDDKSYIIKIVDDEAFLDKAFSKITINQEVEIYQPGERIIHPVTKEVIEIDTVVGTASIKSIKSNYSIVALPENLIGKAKVGQYIKFKGPVLEREEKRYLHLYQTEPAKKVENPNLINISNRGFYFNEEDFFQIARFYYKREIREILGGMALDFISFGFQGGHGKTFIESCESDYLQKKDICVKEKLKPNFIQGFFQIGLRTGSWFTIYTGNGIGLGDTDGANWGFILGAILGNPKSVYLDCGYYRFADFIQYTTIEFNGLNHPRFNGQYV